MRALRRASVAAACVLAAVLVPEAAFAATASVSPSFGRDVSSDTCGALQTPEDFGVVAVNHQIATKANECLPAELAWAAGSTGIGHDAVDVYVLSADPGPALASWWPSSDRTQGGVTVHSPYKTCVGKKATTACAWVYGNSLARNQVALVDPTVSIGRWWIDVEGGASGNTWSSSTAQNRAVVEGMVAGFTSSKKRVGLYAATSHFREVLGTVPAKSSISKLPFWAAGATSRADALKRCSTSSMTAGRLTLVQWTESGDTSVDYDVACGTLTQPKPTISGKYHPKHKLTAKVKTWSPAGVHLTYRWTRDGKAIAKATHSTYTLTKKDRRHRIGVTVTGTLNGYSRAVQKSATHRIGS
jgi:hypothetical protein